MPQYSPLMWWFTVVLTLNLAGSGRGVTSTSVTTHHFLTSCDRENALEIAQQQIALSKTIGADERRIAVLLRAADLIWPEAEDNARKAYAEAFALAKSNFYNSETFETNVRGVWVVGYFTHASYQSSHRRAAQDRAADCGTPSWR